jgi:hypothetical protein
MWRRKRGRLLRYAYLADSLDRQSGAPPRTLGETRCKSQRSPLKGKRKSA